MTFDDWRTEISSTGPLTSVDFLDATWQDEPSWTAHSWVATEAESLVSVRPPWPGVRVRMNVPAGCRATVAITDQAPGTDGYVRVFGSELTVGEHGYRLDLGNQVANVPLPAGICRIEIWVNGTTPDQVDRCVIVLCAWRPRDIRTSGTELPA